MQEPEVNSVELNADDLDSVNVSFDVRIVRNSECCGDEMKEYTFSGDEDVPDEIVQKMREAKTANSDVEFEAQDAGVETLEEGGSRYKKSYYGFALTVDVYYSKPTAQRTPEEQAELTKLTENYEETNKSEALRARRAELFAIGRPNNESLGTFQISDKVQASGMDELN
jgi:hypothetical protein